jgi:biotin carboxylase
MQKIIFIAGGSWQKPFVKYLKEKGNFVAIVNPIVTETTKLADFHIQSDVNDLDTINKYIEKINPIFITSDQSDISTQTVSKLSEKWNLPGNNINVIEKFTNKFEIFTFSKSIGIPAPESSIVNSVKELLEFSKIHGFPIIIKPVDSTMSRGFRKIDSLQQITEEVLQSSKYFSKSNKIIAQTFITGEMVILEGICSGSKHKTLAVCKKEGYFSPGITTGARYSFDIPESIIAANDRYVEMSGMRFGLTHAEYMINEHGFYLIEIGGRGGGAGITDKIVPWVSGINVYDILYSSLMGEVVDVKNLKILNRPALLKYYLKENLVNYNDEKGTIISKIKGVADFNFDFAGKQYVNDKNDMRHTMAIYLAETDDELNKLEKSVMSICN